MKTDNSKILPLEGVNHPDEAEPFSYQTLRIQSKQLERIESKVNDNVFSGQGSERKNSKIEDKNNQNEDAPDSESLEQSYDQENEENENDSYNSSADISIKPFELLSINQILSSPLEILQFLSMHLREYASLFKQEDLENLEDPEENVKMDFYEKHFNKLNDPELKWDCYLGTDYNFNKCFSNARYADYHQGIDKWQSLDKELIICKKCLQVALQIMKMKIKYQEYYKDFENCAFKIDEFSIGDIMTDQQNEKVELSDDNKVYKYKVNSNSLTPPNKTWKDKSVVESFWFNSEGNVMIALCQDPKQTYDWKEFKFSVENNIKYIIKIYNIDNPELPSIHQLTSPIKYKLTLTIPKQDLKQVNKQSLKLNKEKDPENEPIQDSFEQKDRMSSGKQNSIMMIDEQRKVVIIFDKISQRIFIGNLPSLDYDLLSTLTYHIQPIQFTNKQFRDINYSRLSQFYFTGHSKLSFMMIDRRDYHSTYQIRYQIDLGQQDKHKDVLRLGDINKNDVDNNYNLYFDRSCFLERIIKLDDIHVIISDNKIDKIYSFDEKIQIQIYNHKLKGTRCYGASLIKANGIKQLAFQTQELIKIYRLNNYMLEEQLTYQLSSIFLEKYPLKNDDSDLQQLFLIKHTFNEDLYLHNGNIISYNPYTSGFSVEYQSEQKIDRDQQWNSDYIILQGNTLLNTQPKSSRILQYKFDYDYTSSYRVCGGQIFNQQDFYDEEVLKNQIYKVIPYHELCQFLFISDIDLIIFRLYTGSYLYYIYRPALKQLYLLKEGFKYHQYSVIKKEKEICYEIFFKNGKQLLCLIISDNEINIIDNCIPQNFSYEQFLVSIDGDYIINNNSTDYCLYERNEKKFIKSSQKLEQVVLNFNEQVRDQFYDYLKYRNIKLEIFDNERQIEIQTISSHYVLLYPGMNEIHFINNQTLNHSLSIVFPFDIFSVITDDIITEKQIYIASSEINYKLYSINLRNKETNNLPIEQIIVENVYAVINLDSQQIKYYKDCSKKECLQTISFKENIDFNIDFDKMNLQQIFQFHIGLDIQYFQCLMESESSLRYQRDAHFEKIIQIFDDQRNNLNVNFEINKQQFVFIPLEIQSLLYGSIFETIQKLPHLQKKKLLDIMMQYIIQGMQKPKSGVLYHNFIDNYIFKFQEDEKIEIDIKQLVEAKSRYPIFEEVQRIYLQIGDLTQQMFPIQTIYPNNISYLLPTTYKYNIQKSSFFERILYKSRLFKFMLSPQQLHRIINEYAYRLEQLENKSSEEYKEYLKLTEQKRIRYNIVEFKGLLSWDKSLQFLDSIFSTSENDATIFEVPVVRTIIDYKWKTYTQIYYVYQFVAIIIFYVSYLVDINYQISDHNQDDRNLVFIITKSICSAVMLFFLGIELNDMKTRETKLEYFQDPWNYNDFFMIIIYIVYVAISFSGEQLYLTWIKIFQCLIVIAVFIKFLFLLRIFEQLSFLVSMLGSVFIDIRYFLLLFGIVIGAFATVLAIILEETPNDYSDISGISYYAVALRRALADSDTSEVVYSQYPIIAWIHWLAIVIVGNIVFMNFVIAVVGSSYEKYMERSVNMQYKAKLHMIMERERVMIDKEKIKNQLTWFPNYILKIAPEKDVDEDEGDNDWQGLVKQINKSLKPKIQSINTKIEGLNNQIENKIESLTTLINDKEKLRDQKEKERDNQIQLMTQRINTMMMRNRNETRFRIQNSQSKEYIQMSSQNKIEFKNDHNNSSSWLLDHNVEGEIEATEFRIYNKINKEFYLGSDGKRAILTKMGESMSQLWVIMPVEESKNEYYIKSLSDIKDQNQSIEQSQSNEQSEINDQSKMKYLGSEGILVENPSESKTKWVLEEVR